MISGTHGNPEGESGLSKIRCLHQDFYFKDCRSVGVRAGQELPQPLPLPPYYSEDHYDITKKAVPSLERKPDCYLNDPELEDMDFRVADMSYYHKRGHQLVEDIKQESLLKFSSL